MPGSVLLVWRSSIDCNTGVSCGYCKMFKNSSLIQQLWWLHLIVLPRYSKVSWVTYSLILRLHVLSVFIKNFHLAQISLKQFLPCLNWLVTCFWFQNMFWRNINCSRLWWRLSLKHCTSNYVISQVKRLSSSALGGWSGAFNFRSDVLCE